MLRMLIVLSQDDDRNMSLAIADDVTPLEALVMLGQAMEEILLHSERIQNAE